MHQARFVTISRRLRLLFQFLWIFTPVMVCLNWSDIQLWFDFTQRDTAFFGVPIASLDLKTRALCIFISLIPASMWMLALYYLSQLFKLYENNIIFAQQNVNYIKKIGLALCSEVILGVLTVPLLSVAISINNPIGERFIAAAFSSHDFFGLIISLIVVLIGWIMQEGQKLQEEVKYVI